MARTSKKMKSYEKSVTAKKVYSVGIYARLSVGKDERKNESIETQIEIAKAFLREHRDMVLYDCYYDLGETGTSFARKGFERMMQDVRSGRVDCIIVKDLSRFGRNHIETGNYIEKIFPFLGVRFIAVTDFFDSLNYSDNNDAMSVNLKNLMNEMYARDIAVKVKSGKRARWEQGSYIGGVPPYGYRAERINGKKCLLIEAVTSDIVKKIYELFLDGKNRQEIKVWLYEHKIHRPKDYKSSGHVYWQEGEVLREWSDGTIRGMLTNPVYTGCLAKGWSQRKSMVLESQLVKNNTHEAIINKELFLQAALKHKENVVYSNKREFPKTEATNRDIFDGILFCGDCGSKMCRISSARVGQKGNRVRRYYYACPHANRVDELRCNKEYLSFFTLMGLVKAALQKEFVLPGLHPEAWLEENKRERECQKDKWKQQICALDKKIKSIRRNCSEQYVKYRMGELCQKQFLKRKEQYDRRIEGFQKEKEEIICSLRTMDNKAKQESKFIQDIINGNEGMELSEEAIHFLIHRIEVYKNQCVKITFAFYKEDGTPQCE